MNILRNTDITAVLHLEDGELHKITIVRVKRSLIDDFRTLIPNWDIFIIPLWYTFVKEVIKIFRLKELREKRRISQVRLAIELDMNQNSISRYENGVREADYRTLLAFADYFNVSLDYLFGRTDNPEINK